MSKISELQGKYGVLRKAHYLLGRIAAQRLRSLNAWKEAAKNKYEEVEILKRAEKDYEEQLRKFHGLAASRKVLLREIEEWVAVCPMCLIRLKDHPFEHHKKADEHSDTCKLAKELGDE